MPLSYLVVTMRTRSTFWQEISQSQVTKSLFTGQAAKAVMVRLIFFAVPYGTGAQ